MENSMLAGQYLGQCRNRGQNIYHQVLFRLSSSPPRQPLCSLSTRAR